MLEEITRRAQALMLGWTALVLLAAGAIAHADTPADTSAVAPAQAQASAHSGEASAPHATSAASSGGSTGGAASSSAGAPQGGGASSSSTSSSGAATSAGAASGGSASSSASSSSSPSATVPSLGSTSQNPRVRVVTSMGDFAIELYPDRAPLTVANFLRYVREGQYTNTLFHRVIANFVIQGGGHDATSLQLKPTHPPIPNESGNGLQNKRGMVGLARAAAPHSGNCQFYVNLVDNPELDPLPTRWGYAVFGKVIEGMDVVDRIGVTPTGAMGPFKSDSPLTPVVIERIDLLPAGAPLTPAAPGGKQPAPAPASSPPPVLSPR